MVDGTASAIPNRLASGGIAIISSQWIVIFDIYILSTLTELSDKTGIERL